MPNVTEESPLVAPPICAAGHHLLVGTAFDYLFRFYIKRKYPAAFEKSWIAEKSLSLLGKLETAPRYAGDGLSSPDDVKKVFAEASRRIRTAKTEQQKYLNSGKVTDSLLSSVLQIAELDAFYRAGKN